ncbi:MAG: hypothetical protein D6698_14065 [Gammaproteobacteria bacterium]|nr:MAG: hypothetical protein D6698_14065 [Gammaproteobacteria bacterium]
MEHIADRNTIINWANGDMSASAFLMMAEEFLDRHHFYLSNGWENAEILAPPEVSRYKVEVYLESEDNGDPSSLIRMANNRTIDINLYHSPRGENRVVAHIIIPKEELVKMEEEKIKKWNEGKIEDDENEMANSR